ncbi:MAG: hypothetical protein N4A49_04660 [Marinifilaceae bacterium]|jgi:hypothetical protein|nr:hypothetical protein [Marinifilaceae bacterium]
MNQQEKQKQIKGSVNNRIQEKGGDLVSVSGVSGGKSSLLQNKKPESLVSNKIEGGDVKDDLKDGKGISAQKKIEPQIVIGYRDYTEFLEGAISSFVDNVMDGDCFVYVSLLIRRIISKADHFVFYSLLSGIIDEFIKNEYKLKDDKGKVSPGVVLLTWIDISLNDSNGKKDQYNWSNELFVKTNKLCCQKMFDLFRCYYPISYVGRVLGWVKQKLGKTYEENKEQKQGEGPGGKIDTEVQMLQSPAAASSRRNINGEGKVGVAKSGVGINKNLMIDPGMPKEQGLQQIPLGQNQVNDIGKGEYYYVFFHNKETSFNLRVLPDSCEVLYTINVSGGIMTLVKSSEVLEFLNKPTMCCDFMETSVEQGFAKTIAEKNAGVLRPDKAIYGSLLYLFPLIENRITDYFGNLKLEHKKEPQKEKDEFENLKLKFHNEIGAEKGFRWIESIIRLSKQCDQFKEYEINKVINFEVLKSVRAFIGDLNIVSRSSQYGIAEVVFFVLYDLFMNMNKSLKKEFEEYSGIVPDSINFMSEEERGKFSEVMLLILNIRKFYTRFRKWDQNTLLSMKLINEDFFQITNEISYLDYFLFGCSVQGGYRLSNIALLFIENLVDGLAANQDDEVKFKFGEKQYGFKHMDACMGLMISLIGFYESEDQIKYREVVKYLIRKLILAIESSKSTEIKYKTQDVKWILSKIKEHNFQFGEGVNVVAELNIIGLKPVDVYKKFIKYCRLGYTIRDEDKIKGDGYDSLRAFLVSQRTYEVVEQEEGNKLQQLPDNDSQLKQQKNLMEQQDDSIDLSRSFSDLVNYGYEPYKYIWNTDSEGGPVKL